jgi:hypothetical protein
MGGGKSKGGGGGKSDIAMMMMMNQQAEASAREARDSRDMQERLINEARAEKQKELDRSDRIAAERKAAGEAGRSGYIANVKRRLASGLIGEESAQKLVEDYYTKYDLAPIANELEDITKTYQEFAPKRREADLSATYQRLLGRTPTADELTRNQGQMGLGRTLGDIEQDIQATPEYKKARPSSAFEAEMEARYGGPILDETGTRTGKYKYNFGTGTLPGLTADLISKTKITTPSFLTPGAPMFIGSAEEIEGAKQSKNNYESFLYNSGLKSLEGNISAELTKLRTEGELKIGRQQGQYNILTNTIGAFNF